MNNKYIKIDKVFNVSGNKYCYDEYKKGDRVFIVSSSKYCCNEVVGCYGAIDRKTYRNGYYAVKIDNKKNKQSDTGVFWFTKEDLVPLNETLYWKNQVQTTCSEGEDMGIKIDKNVKSIAILGINSNSNYAFCYTSDELKVDDTVIVVNSCGPDNLQISKVEGVFTLEEAKDFGIIEATWEIVDVLDLSVYKHRVEARAEKKKLKAKMDQRIKEIQSGQVYEIFAEKDDELRELLNEYKEL